MIIIREGFFKHFGPRFIILGPIGAELGQFKVGGGPQTKIIFYDFEFYCQIDHISINN